MRSSALFLAAAAAAGTGAQAKLADKYEQMVVFGASYMDNAHKKPADLAWRYAKSPYYDGRFSNGIVSSEHLARLVGIETSSYAFKNWAFAGAVVSNKLTPDASYVYDSAEEVRTFEEMHSTKSKRGVTVLDKRGEEDAMALSLQAHSRGAKMGKGLSARHHARRATDEVELSANRTTHEPRMLVVVGVGLNTLKVLIADNKLDQIQANVDALYDSVVSITKSSVIRGMSPNGKMDLLILGMQPLDKIPSWSQNDVDLALVRKGVSQWNAALSKKLKQLAKSSPVKKHGDRVFSWDSAPFWTKAANTVGDKAAAKTFKAKYGASFTDATNACYKGSGEPCKAQDTTFYWDSVHLTTAANGAMAKAYYKDSVQVTA